MGTPWLPHLLCKHRFLSSVWNFCHWVADVPPCETSPAGKSKEKQLFSQAIFLPFTGQVQDCRKYPHAHCIWVKNSAWFWNMPHSFNHWINFLHSHISLAVLGPTYKNLVSASPLTFDWKKEAWKCTVLPDRDCSCRVCSVCGFIIATVRMLGIPTDLKE